MRVVLACIALLLAACGGQTPAAKMVAPSGAQPDWLPPYTAKQLALLEPTDERVTEPATRTYPELSRFRYARDRQLQDPRDAMRITKIVADVVSQSPHTYTVAAASADVENAVAQYGPPAKPDPDPWSVAVSDRSGRKHLVPASYSDAAKRAYDEAESAKDGAVAIAKMREAIAASPEVPALHLALGDALQAAGDKEHAEAAYREVIRVDTTLASGHAALAALLLEKGDLPSARVSLAHALAYHPSQPQALALAKKIAGRGQRINAFAIFLEVDGLGVVRVAAAPTPGARMYGGCRAVMRYEPELRSALFAEPSSEPYFLSVAEEMFCVESAIGAYLAERAIAREEGRSEPEDQQTAALMNLAHSEGLLGFVMFEVLGRHRPEHARRAPTFVHRATMGYVQRHVLGYDPGPDPSLNLASR
jgi:tetratricopeptide (TPR) repeat protein